MEEGVMDVVVHCDHEFRRPYSPPPKQVKQLLTIRFNTRSYQRILYSDNNNGSSLISTNSHPCSPSNIYTRSRNPFCDKCMVEIVLFLIGHGYSLNGAVDEFSRFVSVVQCKINMMLLSYQHNDDHSRVKFNEVFTYEVRVNAPNRVCSEEEYRTLVANGEVFEPLVVRAFGSACKLAVIKGIEIVADVQELLVKEDDICAICLDEFSVKDEEADKDDGPTIKHQEDVTTDDNNNNGAKNNKLIVRLPCKHVFHEGCAREWVQQNHVCPCCRSRLPVEYHDVDR